jgi:hypothetical protein
MEDEKDSKINDPYNNTNNNNNNNNNNNKNRDIDSKANIFVLCEFGRAMSDNSEPNERLNFSISGIYLSLCIYLYLISLTSLSIIYLCLYLSSIYFSI